MHCSVRRFSLVQANRPAEAAQKYEQLLADFPDSQFAASAVLASAQSTYRSGDIDEAAKRFRKVLQQNNVQAATEAAHWIARIEISRGQARRSHRDRQKSSLIAAWRASSRRTYVLTWPRPYR